jgi:class 3 adenylate cyclase/tetratricopeptide (TPR) repeat protein
MHRLVPDFIVERFTAGEMSGAFRAAGLFVDVSGFSTVTNMLMTHGQLGAEVLARVMRTVFEPLLHSVYEQGGFVVTLAGDAFTALFPFDNPGEQGHQRALAAACAIQERMAVVSEHATTLGTFTLAVKVGVAAGDVDWGIVLSQDGSRAAYYFRGPAVDGCAAAEHCANPGDVVLAPDFYAAVQGLVTVELVTDASSLGDHYRLTTPTAPLPAPGPVKLPPIDLDVTARFYPPALVTQSYGGEFRHVINLFISLPTVRTEAQLAIFMGSLFELQNRYGGLLNRLDFGDKGAHLLLFWGAPMAHENDVERALDFILDLQIQTSIPINAGVTYHIAHAGFIGSSLREEYTCFGRGVNLAARFMTHAARGEIWVDEAVAGRAERRYDLEFEGMQTFKGFAEPQRVYVLYERQEEIEAMFQGELVGREAELAQLADFCAPLLEGQYAGVMVVRGEAGIGKSRLLHAFLTDAAYGVSETCQSFLAQTDEILQGAFDPFRYWLRRYFGQSQSQSEARNKRAFNRTLDRLIDATRNEALNGELDRTRSFLGGLVDLRWPDSLYEQLDPQGRHENSFIGLLSLLQAESLQRSVIVHLEDAHWLDEASRAFLARLVQALTADDRKSYPFALIVTTRPTGRETLLEGVAYRKIDLVPLAGDNLARLAQDQLGGAASPELLALVVERSEGNPFFAEQILRYLRGQDILALSGDGWRVVDETEASPLPTDVRAVLVARLDQLTQDVKEVVQAASVLGREFEIQVLARMLYETHALPEKIAQAEQAAIWAPLSELLYIFRHALLRDAAYHMQLQAQRQTLHAMALISLEGLYAEGATPQYGELAYHAEEAGLLDKARVYLQQAGDAAREAYENSLAIDYYNRALALVPADDADTRRKLLLAREDVWHLLGMRDEQQDDLGTLIDLAETSGDLRFEAEVALRRSRHAGVIGAHRSAIAAARDAVNIALKGGHIDQAAQGYRRWGWYLMRQTAYDEARQRLEQALAYARTAGNLEREADCLNSLGTLFLETAERTAALEYYQQARALYQQIGDQVGESSTWNNQGGVAYGQGKYADAIAFYERAFAIRRQIGNRRGEGNTLYNLGAALRHLGRYARARACHEGSLAIARQVGDRRGEGLVLNSLGLLAANLGDYATAWDNCEKSLGIFQEIGDRMLVTNAHTNLGSFAVEQGRFGEAERHYRSALDLARETARQPDVAFALDGLGWARLGLGQIKDARAFFQQAVATWQALGESHHLVHSQSGLARVALAQGEPLRAVALVDEILDFLNAHSLAGSGEPFSVHLTCVQVLQAVQDSRAAVVLEQAFAKLQEQAARISDDAMRRAFLHDVPDHRQLADAYQKLQALALNVADPHAPVEEN